MKICERYIKFDNIKQLNRKLRQCEKFSNWVLLIQLEDVQFQINHSITAKVVYHCAKMDNIKVNEIPYYLFRTKHTLRMDKINNV